MREVIRDRINKHLLRLAKEIRTVKLNKDKLKELVGEIHFLINEVDKNDCGGE